MLGEEVPGDVVLIEGNHDEHMRFLVADVPGASRSQTRRSLDRILASGRTKRDVAALVGSLLPAPALRFTRRGGECR